ncbi:MAG: iron-containing alcohol dehydrogenase [Pirellulales bacterium]|nr:iron-containing alcohol dehydrogenase [Thermoguttaceae bacterium]MDD4786030.1 iron-containing alcohol dehydrogenase [Pirellulales bacterium]
MPVIYTGAGVFLRTVALPRNPDLVLVDTRVIAAAPVRFLVAKVNDFCESVGLPTTLAQVGLGEASGDDLRRVAEAACREGETIHHESCPVSADAVVAALKAANRFGRNRPDRRHRAS